MLIQAGRAESPVTVTTEGVDVTAHAGRRLHDRWGPRDRLWAAVDLPRGAVGGAGMNGSRDDGRQNGPYSFPVRVAEFAEAGELPAVPGGLSSVRVILAEAGPDLTGEVADRLGDWVAGGGHLVLSADPAGGPLPDFVPVDAGGPEPLTAYSALEALAGRGGSGGGGPAEPTRAGGGPAGRPGGGRRGGRAGPDARGTAGRSSARSRSGSGG